MEPTKEPKPIEKHYQLVILTTELYEVFTTTLLIKEEDPRSQNPISLANLLCNKFLLDLKHHYLSNQNLIHLLEVNLRFETLDEIIRYNEDTSFGYLIQDITDPKNPTTFLFHSIDKSN